ncbi:MAG: hypothetical protein Q7S76_00790 [bacterium]|nr:hypothetical protein [bacterium]
MSTIETEEDLSRFTQATVVVEALSRTIAELRFDPLSLYVDFLEGMSLGQNIFDAWQSWQPNPLIDTHRLGGSDCFGLVTTLKHELITYGYETSIIPLDTDGLAPGASSATGEIGSVALGRVRDQGVVFMDPAFALTQPVLLTPNAPDIELQVDGRRFWISADFDNKSGRLVVVSDYHGPKNIGIQFSELPDGSLGVPQKLYLKVRTAIQCERIGEDGRKVAGVKVNLMNDTIAVCDGSNKYTLSRREWVAYDKTELANKLDIPQPRLERMVDVIIKRSGQLRALWVDSLRTEYLQKNAPPLREVDAPTDWSVVRTQGYESGGVVAFIVNPEGQILMHTVPPTREKPHIGRFSGQLNTLVETAEGEGGIPSEPFIDNLVRGLREELGILPESNRQPTLREGSYRETDYGKPRECGNRVLARCCVLDFDPKQAGEFHFNNQDEGGDWKWYDLDRVLGYEIDPGVRPILERYIAEKLL